MNNAITNMDSKGIKLLIVENEILKGLKEDTGEFLSDFWVGKLYLNVVAREEKSMNKIDI